MSKEHYGNKDFFIEAIERSRSGEGITHFNPFATGATLEQLFDSVQQRAEWILSRRLSEGKSYFIELTLPVKEEHTEPKDDK